jgi:hypothetical protein
MKNLLVVFIMMLTVALIICTMELADEIKFYELIALGFASTISVIGCIGAAAAIKMSIED